MGVALLPCAGASLIMRIPVAALARTPQSLAPTPHIPHPPTPPSLSCYPPAASSRSWFLQPSPCACSANLANAVSSSLTHSTSEEPLPTLKVRLRICAHALGITLYSLCGAASNLLVCLCPSLDGKPDGGRRHIRGPSS